jgi:hypothetical protein
MWFQAQFLDAADDWMFSFSGSGGKSCETDSNTSPLHASGSFPALLASPSTVGESENLGDESFRQEVATPSSSDARELQKNQLLSTLAVLNVKLMNDRASFESKRKSSSDNTTADIAIWAGQIIRGSSNEILMRVARQQPKSRTKSRIFDRFAVTYKDEFQRLKSVIAPQKDDAAVIEDLNTMVTHRNVSIHCNVLQLNERVLAIRRLFCEYSNLQRTFFKQYTIIQNYERLKSLFSDQFQDL